MCNETRLFQAVVPLLPQYVDNGGIYRGLRSRGGSLLGPEDGSLRGGNMPSNSVPGWASSLSASRPFFFGWIDQMQIHQVACRFLWPRTF